MDLGAGCHLIWPGTNLVAAGERLRGDITGPGGAYRGECVCACGSRNHRKLARRGRSGWPRDRHGSVPRAVQFPRESRSDGGKRRAGAKATRGEVPPSGHSGPRAGLAFCVSRATR